MKTRIALVPAAALAAFAPLFATTTAAASGADEPDAVTLVTYDSFQTSDTTLIESLDRFTAETGIEVEILVAGDTGTMVSKAILTAGNPEGDVLFGVDNTYVSRAVEGGVFEPYEAAGLDAIPAELLDAAPTGPDGPFVTPVDYGDVCVNYDIDWFAEHDLEPPTNLQSLTDPAYEDLLVVENPASSSPGLAFLMATVAEFGTDWPAFWTDLEANGMEVVDDWTGAYYERFSGASDGPKPLVVSYGSSPPFEVIYADPTVDEPSTGVLADTCFRQIEFAAVLAGTDAPDEARQLVDWMVGGDFQREIALNLFVYPANDSVELPPEIEEFSVVPAEPYTLDPDEITANREEWIEVWTDTVQR